MQRRLKSEVLRRHNDVAGFLFSAVGVLYAVVLGFVVVVVWQKYDDAVSNVENEVDAVANLYHVVDAFPTTERNQIRAGLRAYAETVALVEWPAMNRDQEVPETGTKQLEGIVAYASTRSRRRNFKEFAAQQAAIVERDSGSRRAARAADRIGPGRSLGALVCARRRRALDGGVLLHLRSREPVRAADDDGDSRSA